MNTIAPLRTDAETQLIAQFEALKAQAPADLPVRAAAFQQFEASGLPHRRVESWHYTDLRRLMGAALAPAARPNAAALAAAQAGARPASIVLLDGFFAASSGLPSGVVVGTAPVAGSDLGSSDNLVALNTAFARETVNITVAPGTQLDAPLHIVSKLSRNAAIHTRVVIEVGAGAKLAVIDETQASAGQVNSLLHIVVGDSAEVELVSLQGNAGQHVASFTADLNEKSVLNSFGFVSDGALVRRQAFVRFNGEYASAGLRGVSLLKGTQHADTTLVVEHAAPHCVSRELFKHILDGEAKGVFQGKIIVQSHAQKTDGVMKSNTLTLSEGASMSNKPELEIFADDVVCGHGATVGQLDEDQMFYLMARGLPKAEAESLLIEAFAVDALEAIGNEALRAELTARVHGWLAGRSGGVK